VRDLPAEDAERPPYRLDPEQVFESWAVDRDKGLSGQEVKKRRQAFGPNRLREARRKSAWRVLLDQFKSIVVLLLLAASLTAAGFGRFAESIAIAAALVINAAIGFFTEIKAIRSMEALRRLGQMTATVRRGGEERSIDAVALVPGDIVLLEEGDVVPADLRLVETENLQCDESALTGESVPVAKSTETLADDDPPIAERANIAFKGTAVTRGTAEGVVVATGMKTEIGRISELVEEAGESVTPLERRLDNLGRRLIWLVIAIAFVIAGAGLIAGKDVAVMIETALALAIAAVPEGLPIVSTVALGRGMWRMAKRNALVKQLSAVETLGATNVIFTDKTGTLTENRMVLNRIALASGDVELKRGTNGKDAALVRGDETIASDEDEALAALLEVVVLCNNASLNGSSEDQTGAPTEIALLAGGRAVGLERDTLLEELPEEREESFSAETKMMATYHRDDGGLLVAVKGAPEPVLDACTKIFDGGEPRDLDDDEKEEWRKRNEELAAEGLRVLAVARRHVEDVSEEPYRDLTFLGLVGLFDPPRETVPDAIAACRDAGIRVVMVTGDQPATAANIAHSIGIVDGRDARVIQGRELEDQADEVAETRIFARVSPEQKLDLISAFQEHAGVVGMTGDGVNDAPALKKADIGIAMGRRGTEVARETSDIVLKDDAFETIVMAIEQGRAIFNNIRKFIVFLLSGNLGQIVAVSAAALVNAPLPLLPLQILFINLLFDVFPALALGVGRGAPGLMALPPRDPGEPILTRGHWSAVVGYGFVIAASVLGTFAYALLVMELDTASAVTVSFLTFGFARLWHVFNMRSAISGTFVNEVTRNPYIWWAIMLCGVLLAAAVFVPGLAELLDVVPPTGAQWLLILVGGFIPVLVVQPFKIILGRRRA